MTNYILNPAATELEINLKVAIGYLETEGWDFDSYGENTVDYLQGRADEGEDIEVPTFEAAMNEIRKKCTCTVRIITLDGKPSTDYFFTDTSKNETWGAEETGDDEQTIKDIITLLNAGLVTINDADDLSRDDDGNYVPTFIEETQTA